MSQKLIKVRLILADRVKPELARLNKAETEGNYKSRAKAVAVAKRLVRESVVVQAMPDGDVVREVPQKVYRIYAACLRDVGDDTFVFDEKSLRAVLSHLKKISSSSKASFTRCARERSSR